MMCEIIVFQGTDGSNPTNKLPAVTIKTIFHNELTQKIHPLQIRVDFELAKHPSINRFSIGKLYIH